jgi:hypothetical protein
MCGLTITLELASSRSAEMSTRRAILDLIRKHLAYRDYFHDLPVTSLGLIDKVEYRKAEISAEIKRRAIRPKSKAKTTPSTRSHS